MSYLTINGFPVPVAADSLRVKQIEIGNRDRAFSGAQLSDIRATKNRISARTTPLVDSDAKLLRALLRRQFDTMYATGTLNTDRGQLVTSGAAQLVPYIAADGCSMGDLPFVGHPDCSHYCCLGPFTNLLTANQRSVETNTTGFTAIDSASISCVSAHAAFGSKCLKVVTLNNSNSVAGGVYCDVSVAAANKYYFCSVYVTGSGSVKLRAENVTLGTSTYSDAVTLVPGHWTKIAVSVATVTPGSAQTLRLSVVEAVADSAITFFCDGFAIQESNNNGDEWGNATTTTPVIIDRASGSLLAEEFSVLAWVKVFNDDDDVVPFNATDAVQNVIALVATARCAGVDMLIDGTSVTCYCGSTFDEAEWVLVGMSISRDLIQVFAGAADSADNYNSAVPTALPLLSLLTTVETSMAAGHISNLVVLKHALTRAQYQSIYAGWSRYWRAPFLNVEGDAIAPIAIDQDGEGPVLVATGRIIDEKQIGASGSTGTWANNLTEIELELEEA